MRPRLLLVSDGLEPFAPQLARDLRHAGLRTLTIGRKDLPTLTPADIVVLWLKDADPVAACRRIHRQGHRWIVAVSPDPNPDDCIRVLNAGADEYVPAAQGHELIARLRSLLRLRGWGDRGDAPDRTATARARARR